MSMNFGFSAESAVRNTRRPLAPWGIYKVKFTGAEIATFKGHKDPNAEYKVLRFNFENEDGYYSESLFFPKDGDDQRRSYESNGGTVQMPSSLELTMAVVKQTLQVLSPKGYAAVQKASAKFKSFDDVANATVQVLDKVKGIETNLKLIGRVRDGKVVAQIPRLVGISKDGEAFISDNYIGDKLYFSDYEEGKRAEFLNTKTTKPVELTTTTTTETNTEDDSSEVEALLAGL